MTTSYQYEPNSKGQSKHNKSTFPKTSEFLFSNRKKKKQKKKKKKKATHSHQREAKKKTIKKTPQSNHQIQKWLIYYI